MMKKQNKKRGFTIIELVIVVTVIAILSAVLIPTFAGVIKRSRETSDQSAVRNMNSILATENIDEDMNIYEVYDVLAENGIDADNYKPLFKDRFFFYDSALKQVVYTDENYNVLYPDVKGADKANWTSLSGEIKKADIKDIVEKNATSVSIDTAEAFVAVMDAVNEGKNRVENLTTVTLTKDINLMGANLNFGKVEGNLSLKAESEVEIKGFRNDKALHESQNQAGIDTDYGFGLFPTITSGEVVVENIKFVNAVVGDSDPSKLNSQFGFIAGAVNGGTLTVRNVTFENCYAVGCQKVGLVAGQIQGSGKVVLENVKATNCVVSGGSQAAKVVGYISVNDTNTTPITKDANCDFSGVTVEVDAANYTYVNGTQAKYTLTAADAAIVGGQAGDIFTSYMYNGTVDTLDGIATQMDCWFKDLDRNGDGSTADKSCLFNGVAGKSNPVDVWYFGYNIPVV